MACKEQVHGGSVDSWKVMLRVFSFRVRAIGRFSHTLTRFVELLPKDYVISEAKKGYYRFLDDDERQKARIEEEKLIEQKGTFCALFT